jgi:CheY-like chemotaxis protein
MPSPDVLIVDDDLADFLAVLLAGEGYPVRAVIDGRAALRELDRARPALVITDVMHPGPDGYAVVSACRERPDPIPVLLTSAGSRDPALPGVPFLAKPFDLDAFFAVVRWMLAHGA